MGSGFNPFVLPRQRIGHHDVNRIVARIDAVGDQIAHSEMEADDLERLQGALARLTRAVGKIDVRAA